MCMKIISEDTTPTTVKLRAIEPWNKRAFSYSVIYWWENINNFVKSPLRYENNILNEKSTVLLPATEHQRKINVTIGFFRLSKNWFSNTYNRSNSYDSNPNLNKLAICLNLNFNKMIMSLTSRIIRLANLLITAKVLTIKCHCRSRPDPLVRMYNNNT